MKKLLILLFIGGIVIACGNAGAGTSAGTATAAAADTPSSEGAKIYKLNCVTCHGLYGDMGAAGAYNLQQSKLTLEERIEVITNGRNTMTGFKSMLTPDKIKLVAAYTFELKPD